jgi:hypothetical protein
MFRRDLYIYKWQSHTPVSTLGYTLGDAICCRILVYIRSDRCNSQYCTFIFPLNAKINYYFLCCIKIFPPFATPITNSSSLVTSIIIYFAISVTFQDAIKLLLRVYIYSNFFLIFWEFLSLPGILFKIPDKRTFKAALK